MVIQRPWFTSSSRYICSNVKLDPQFRCIHIQRPMYFIYSFIQNWLTFYALCSTYSELDIWITFIKTYPVWKITDSLISHKLKNSTMSHSVWILVGELEQHWICDVKPACKERKVNNVEKVHLFFIKRFSPPLTEMVKSWRWHYYWKKKRHTLKLKTQTP